MKRKTRIDGIQISEFIGNYLGTHHCCNKLKHQGLKSFNNPYIIGVSNDFAMKNSDCITRQEIIVVIDDYGNPGTYLNPINIMRLTELEVCKEKLKLLQKLCFHNFTEVAASYDTWIELSNKVMYLESVYGFNYNLLYYMEKTSVIRDIRKYAKMEAKKLIYDVTLTNEVVEPTIISNYDIFDTTSLIEEDEEQESAFENYKIMEKVNRQKKLKCYKKIG